MNKVTFTPCLRKKYSNDKDGIINIRVTENRKSKYFSLKINICIISIIIDKMYKVFPKDLVQYMKKVASFEGLPFIPTGKRITFLNKELLRELFTPEVVDKISKKFNGSEANEFKEQFTVLYEN